MKKALPLVLSILLLASILPAVYAADDGAAAMRADPVIQVSVRAEVSYTNAFRVLDYTNQERAKNGLAPLIMDQELMEAALQRAYEIILYFDHTRPNGQDNFSINSRVNGENIGAGGTTVEQMMERWMKSNYHRPNILNAGFKSIGVACIKAGNQYYWVQCFSRGSGITTAVQQADAAATRSVSVKCSGDLYNPQFSLSDTSLQLGESAKLSVTWKSWQNVTLPFNGITVESSNPGIVRVDGDTVTAVADGMTELRVYFNGYPAGGASFVITSGKGGFLDISPEEYYAPAVRWAVERTPAITNGTDPTHFSPDAGCTRAQAVTFLWRAAGCPEPKSVSCPFTDVPTDTYYYKPVLWAVEQDITNGVSKTAFAPEETCTRAHIVTFLLRAQKGAPSLGAAAPFVDLEANSWYTDAVLWAVQKEITNGTDTQHFSPNATCTRAQIVTFIWRSMK